MHCIAFQKEPGRTIGMGFRKNWTLMDVLNGGPNNPNDEKTHNYTITGQTWSEVRYHFYNDIRYSRASQSRELISDSYLTLSFDGKETVNVPVGSFFGSGRGKFGVGFLMLSIDALIDNERSRHGGLCHIRSLLQSDL
jgi:hypothetical protein